MPAGAECANNPDNPLWSDPVLERDPDLVAEESRQPGAVSSREAWNAHESARMEARRQSALAEIKAAMAALELGKPADYSEIAGVLIEYRDEVVAALASTPSEGHKMIITAMSHPADSVFRAAMYAIGSAIAQRGGVLMPDEPLKSAVPSMVDGYDAALKAMRSTVNVRGDREPPPWPAD